MSAELFRIEFFCDGKRLPAAVMAITGIAVGEPKIQGVVNAAKKKNGKIEAASDGDVVSLFLLWLKQHKELKTLRAEHFRAFAKSIGRSETSYTFIKNQIMKTGGLLRRTGTGSATSYKVLGR
jgi:hypothetical protein